VSEGREIEWSEGEREREVGRESRVEARLGTVERRNGREEGEGKREGCASAGTKEITSKRWNRREAASGMAQTAGREHTAAE